MLTLKSARARRLFAGWSANSIQILLSLTQQVILVPIFLRYWSGDTLAAWFTIFAAGNLVLIADGGLHIWSLNRFLAFKPSADGDRETGRYYSAALKLYAGFAISLVVLFVVALQFIAPSNALGFPRDRHLDIAFLVMIAGMAATLPSNLPSALYRARGLYGRSVGIQCAGLALAQLGQILGLMITGSLLAVVIAFVMGQVATMLFMLLDARRKFAFPNDSRMPVSRFWISAQLRGAFPFGIMNLTELVLTYAPVLMVSIFVTDRIAISQWALTRTIAGLLKGLCVQMTLPLAAELGQDHAAGLRDRVASLYLRGSVLLAVFVSTITSAAFAFWPDFFALWTNGSIPYDLALTVTLLLGTCVGAPSILALSYANYSNRGYLLLWTKTLQLGIFLLCAIVLIPAMGPLGAAIAVVSSDIIVQLGILSSIVGGETLKRPLRHSLFLYATMAIVLAAGIVLGDAIRWLIPGGGPFHFLIESALWVATVAALASPLANTGLRQKFLKMITA